MKFESENLKERNPLEGPCLVDGRRALKWILKEWDVRACAEFTWLRIVMGGGLL
jgi:hypothetical protein